MGKLNFYKELMNQIYENFVSSYDFNGLSLDNLCCLSNKESLPGIIKLVQEGNVQIIAQSHDENPHIIRFGFMPKEEQVRCLQQYNGDETVCIYPSSSYLEKHRNVSDYELKPFERMLALGHPQLKACYFEYDVLLNYSSDPRIEMKFSDYSGSIISKDVVNENQYINLKTFGIGRNNESVIIVSYPRYLRNMSTANQFQWISHQITNDTDCKTLENYQNNLFNGSWAFPNTVYRSILEEIHNINELTSLAFNSNLFSHEFSKNELPAFDMLSFSSLNFYNQFLLLLEKVIISNINSNFLKLVIDTVDENGQPKGTLSCLKQWITVINPDIVEGIFNPLYKVRNERQAPAHKIEENTYSNDFLVRQHRICCEVYTSLNLLRQLLQSHPKAIGHSIKYPSTQYIEI